MSRSFRTLSVLAVSLLAAAGCSATGDGPQADDQTNSTISDQEAQAAVFSSLRERMRNVDAVYFADDLGDYLPTQMVRVEGESPRPVSPGVIIGAVATAEVTSAYKIGGQEDPDGVPVDANAPDADWRVITVTFNVTNAWSNEVVDGDRVTFDVSVSGSENVEVFLQGLESMDDAVVALDGTNQIGDASYSVAQNGTLLGLAGSDGITFPALAPREDASFVGDLDTPAQVEAAADEPQQAIVVNDGVVVDTGE